MYILSNEFARDSMRFGAETSVGRVAKAICFTAVLILASGLESIAGWVFPHPSVAPTPYPNHVLSADLNGDGHIDLIATAMENARIEVVLGRGDGTFEPPVIYPVHNVPAFMVLADFDGDGHDDLALTHKYEGPVSVLMGNGDGTFGPAAEYGQAADRGGLEIGDFNEDGEFDLLAMGRYNAFLLFGSGDGSFGGEITLPGDWAFLAVDDFNGDGFDDYAYTLSDDGLLALELGNGDGTFSSGGTLPVGLWPTWLTAGDVSDDAIPDLVVVNNQTNDLSVLIGNGDGTFAPDQRHSLDGAGTYPVFVMVTDVDDDGLQDLAVSHWWGLPQISLLYGTGGGQFEAAIGTNRTTGFGQTMAIADLDEDGAKDLVRVQSSPGDLNVIFGDGHRGFVNVNHEQVGEEPQSVAVEDLNGDGRLDLVTANGHTKDVSVLLADGAGSFAPESRFCVVDSPDPPPPCLTEQRPNDLDVGELTGDAHLDLAVVSVYSEARVTILQGDGAGDFAVLSDFSTGLVPAPYSPDPHWSIVVGELNGDGKNDLVVAAYQPSLIRVFLGNGDGTFVAQPTVPVGDQPKSLTLGDLNGDPHLDLVVTNHGSNTVTVLLGNGNGTFTISATLVTGSEPNDTAVGDLNGDLIADLFVIRSLYAGAGHVFLGNGDGTFGFFPLTVDARRSNSAVIGDFDGDGLADAATVGDGWGSVYVLPGRGDGTFGPAQVYRTGSGPNAIIVAGDFNLDSRLDLVNSSEGGDRVCVLLNQSGPRALSLLSDRATLVWPAVTGAQIYNIYRGYLSDLDDGDGDGLPDDGYGVCVTGLDDDARDTFFLDADLPSSDDGFFYLMSVQDAGGDGGIGTTSAGLARVPEVACP